MQSRDYTPGDNVSLAATKCSNFPLNVQCNFIEWKSINSESSFWSDTRHDWAPVWMDDGIQKRKMFVLHCGSASVSERNRWTVITLCVPRLWFSMPPPRVPIIARFMKTALRLCQIHSYALCIQVPCQFLIPHANGHVFTVDLGEWWTERGSRPEAASAMLHIFGPHFGWSKLESCYVLGKNSKTTNKKKTWEGRNGRTHTHTHTHTHTYYTVASQKTTLLALSPCIMTIDGLMQLFLSLRTKLQNAPAV